MNVMNHIYRLFTGKQITPILESNDSIVDISDDLTTYIRCLFHDFRGPLNNISMAVDVLLGTINIKPQDFEILKTIKDSCIFMSDSLDGFLNLQNIHTTSDLIELKYTPFHIVGLIKKVQYILLFNIINKKINIKYCIRPLHEWVIGDQKHIQHVLVNLLSNAIKFSKENSNILIKLEAGPVIHKIQTITIYVIDENDWIPTNIKQILFTKYVTSDKCNGTGLGLYICKKIIELHGGTIIHENYHGKPDNGRETSELISNGNLFKIKLDLEVCSSGSEFGVSDSKDDKSVSVLKTNKKIFFKEIINNGLISKTYNMIKYRANSNQSIMRSIDDNNSVEIISKKNDIRPAENAFKTDIEMFIIDDSELSRKLLKRIFLQNCNNMKIYEAEDGLDAIIKINRKINDISLILVDNIMPNITGVLFSKLIRGLGYKGLIIGITGNGIDKDRLEFEEAGADYVFTKPFNKEKFDKIMIFISKNGYESIQGGKIIEKSNKLEWENRD
jgi:CheY-like chemotaxis protein